MENCKDKCVQTCDRCTHYVDGGENRTIEVFIGKGICDIDNKNVKATSGRNCNDFHCFNCD